MSADNPHDKEQLRIIYEYSVRYLQSERERLERVNTRIATMITLLGILFGFVVFALQTMSSITNECLRIVTIGISLLTLIILGVALFLLTTAYSKDQLEGEMSSNALVKVYKDDSLLSEEDLLRKLSNQLAETGDNYRGFTNRRSDRIRFANKCSAVALVLTGIVGAMVALSGLMLPEENHNGNLVNIGAYYHIDVGEVTNSMFFSDSPDDKKKSDDKDNTVKTDDWKDDRFRGEKIAEGEQKPLPAVSEEND